MDDQQGNVIDGTERARQWRRSRVKTDSPPEGSEARSDAPKSLAGSLLVPAEMLSPAAEPAEGVNGNGNGHGARIRASSRPDRPTNDGAPIRDDVRQNPFLMPEAARVDRPGRSTRGREMAAELVHRLGGRARLLLPTRPGWFRVRYTRRSRALRPTHRLAMAAAVAAIVTTAVLVTHSGTSQPTAAHRPSTSATATINGPSASAILSDADALRAMARSRAAETTSRRHTRRSVPAHRRARRSVKHAGTSAPYVPATSNSVTTAPVSVSPSYSSGSTAGTSEPAPSTTGGTTGGSSSGGSSRPAFGQNGTLGPGHSPNS